MLKVKLCNVSRLLSSALHQWGWKYLEDGGKDYLGVWGTNIDIAVINLTEVPQALVGGLRDKVPQKLSIFAYVQLQFRHLVMNQTTFNSPYLID